MTGTLPPLTDPSFLGRLQRVIEQLFQQKQTRNQPYLLAEYTVAELPPAASWKSCLVNVSNETGGYVPAFSDGTNWRRVTDRAIVS